MNNIIEDCKESAEYADGNWKNGTTDSGGIAALYASINYKILMEIYKMLEQQKNGE